MKKNITLILNFLLAFAWIPETHGARILVATWCLISLIFVSSYGGILTALLTLPKVEIAIDNLRDLVYKDVIPFNLETDSFSYDYFKVSSLFCFLIVS